MVEVALPAQQSEVASVPWGWNSSLLGSSDPKNTEEGLNGAKAPKDGAPSLEGFNRVDVAPRSVVDPWQCWGNAWMGTGNFPSQMIPDFLTQGFGAASGGGLQRQSPGFAHGSLRVVLGALWGLFPPGLGHPGAVASTGLSWTHEPAPAPQG